VDEHNHNVVMLLQSKLANTSMTFKDVLEIRTQVGLPDIIKNSEKLRLLQNMKESKDRTEQFMYTTASAANQTPSSKYCRVIPWRYLPFHRVIVVQGGSYG